MRAVWLWLRSQGLSFPLRATTMGQARWVQPTYHQVLGVLANPIYAGAYVYGRTHIERYIAEDGRPRKRVRRLARADWEVLIEDHHRGFIDWPTFEANQAKIAHNTWRSEQPVGVAREGQALLQGIAVCGRCARKLKVHYDGRRGHSRPGYPCPGSVVAEGRGGWCLRVGGAQIDEAVSGALLGALTPAGVKAALIAAESLEADHDQALEQWRLQVERARYDAQRAERRYRQVEPEHRLVARGLERDWEHALAALQSAEAELERRERARPRTLSDAEREQLLCLGSDLGRVWSAPSTTDRDRKQLLRCLIEEVMIDAADEQRRVTLTVRWRGGMISELTVQLRRYQPKIRTDEDTVALLERLASHYDDATIAGILNRQGRLSATGERFTAQIVGGVRRYRRIPSHQAPAEQPDGEPVTVTEAAELLGVAASTVHRWLAEGFIAGEQDTPGAPWRIRITDELRARLVEQPPEGWLTVAEARHALGISRQTVLQRVKRGELNAVHVRNGRQKGRKASESRYFHPTNHCSTPAP